MGGMLAPNWQMTELEIRFNPLTGGFSLRRESEQQGAGISLSIKKRGSGIDRWEAMRKNFWFYYSPDI